MQSHFVLFHRSEKGWCRRNHLSVCLSVHSSVRLIPSGISLVWKSLNLRHQLPADSRIITVSFPVSERKHRGEISLSARRCCSSARPTCSSARTQEASTVCWKLEPSVIHTRNVTSTFMPISVSSNRKEGKQFFTWTDTRQPGRFSWKNIFNCCWWRRDGWKDFLSVQFEVKMLLRLIYSWTVSLWCQSGCESLSEFLVGRISSVRGSFTRLFIEL